MQLKSIVLSIILFTSPLIAADYYLNSVTGSDGNNGLTPENAFASIKKINTIIFQPGDTIHIAPDSEYHGTLTLNGSGNAIAPIKIFTDHEGQQAVIHGDGAAEAVLLENAEFWEISNLAITNKGPERVKYQVGLRIRIRDFGVAHHIYINNLTISDVFGSLDKNTEGHGILAQNVQGPKHVSSRFDDLRIENCSLTRTDRNGICMQSSFINRKHNWFPSTNVIIRGNTILDCGGDAIKPWGCDGALVEYNFVNGCRQRCEDYAAGIWPWSCDNTIIQYNEVCNTKGIKDGQGFDSDYNCNNTIIQYNYSHDNEGGFLLVCGPKISDSNAGCNNTIVRFNLSQNDGIDTARVFHISGSSVNNTYIYNNVIYLSKDQNVPMLIFGDWEGYASNTYFYNNIFYVESKTSYEIAEAKNTIFENNIFYGQHENQPADLSAITADPRLTAPGSGTTRDKSLTGYKLLEDSPAFHTGRTIQNIGRRDFYGNPITPNTPTSIGLEMK